MSTVTLTVYNNQQLEIFSKPRGGLYDGYEVWLVGGVKGQRTVLSHFITHEHLERRLSYAHAGDLVWRDANPFEIPHQKTAVAQAEEEIMQQGKFLNLDSVAYYFNGMASLPTDRKAWNAARKAILGNWTDGVATILFEPEHKLSIFCPPAAAHPLYTAVHDNHADWWNVVPWMLFLMNNGTKHGERTGVWRCDDELHISSQRRDTLVHVFRRTG